MPTLRAIRQSFGGWARSRLARGVAFAGLLTCLLPLAACQKDIAQEASDSDANGYVCLKCEAKFYTDRSVFIGPKCPKCQEDSLVEAVGYVCSKDGRLAIRGRGDDRRSGGTCESCGGPLGGMRLPREKDLKAWGATKVSS